MLAAHTIPMILLLLWGGVISDRFPRAAGAPGLQRRVGGHARASSPSLVLTGSAELWMIIVLSVVHGAVSAIVASRRWRAWSRSSCPREQLQPANALMSLTRNGLTVLGPTVGALLVVTVGSGWALAVDAADLAARGAAACSR